VNIIGSHTTQHNTRENNTKENSTMTTTYQLSIHNTRKVRETNHKHKYFEHTGKTLTKKTTVVLLL